MADRYPGRFPNAPRFVKLLKAKPNLWAGIEPVAETQGCLGGDGALAVYDLGDAVHRHRGLAGEFRRACA